MPSITSVGATILGVDHHTVELNGTELHYVSAGSDGPPVLLVHGFPETWWAFRKLIPLIAGRHRVIAVDLRGFGDSAVAADGDSTTDAAEDLHALAAHLALGPVHVVGQDVSGGVVFRFAATHPEDVTSLTAIESGLGGFGAEALADVANGGVWYIGALAAPGVGQLLFEDAAARFIGDYLYPLYGVSPAVVSAEDVAEYARCYGRKDGFSGAAALYRGMIHEGDELQALAAGSPLRMPVAAIGSSGGGFTHGGFSAVSEGEVADIHLDGIGHYVAQEAPERLAEILLKIFAEVEV